ncbi:MAG TPA: DUF6079 family protein [Halanaerobiales bacterium]|nr:DUF6079 family protein [Halanaerobiales bacterium]
MRKRQVVVDIKLSLDNLYEQKVMNKNSVHNPEHERIQQLVMTLEAKIKFLAEDYQEDTLKLVKGMAYLSMTDQRQAILPEIMVQDLNEGLNFGGDSKYVEQLLYSLREVTGGQFINKYGEDCFGLDLIHCLDYDRIIREKAGLLTREDEIEGLLHFLQQGFGLVNSRKVVENVFLDFFSWPARNSYQKVTIAFNEARVPDTNPVLMINISSDTEKDIINSADSRRITINIYYDQELAGLIRELIIVDKYNLSSNYPSGYLKRKQEFLSARIEECFLEIIKESTIVFPEKVDTPGKLIKESSSLKELYGTLKLDLFTGIFKSQYPDHPVFPLEITPANIKDRIEGTVISLLTEEYNTVSREILKSLFVFNQQDNLDISSSPYIERLRQFMDGEAEGIIPVEKIILQLGREPYGLQKEFSYLLLVILVYLGVVRLYQPDQVRIEGVKTLKRLFSSNITLFSNGLDKFEEKIGYVRMNKKNLERLQPLFSVLGLKRERAASGYLPYLLFKEFSRKMNMIREESNRAKNLLQDYLHRPVPGVDEEVIKDKMINLDKYILNKLLEIKSIEDLQNLSLSKLELEELEISLRYLNNLLKFLDYYDQRVLPAYHKLHKDLEAGESQEKLTEVLELMKKSWQRVDQYQQLIDLSELIKAVS